MKRALLAVCLLIAATAAADTYVLDRGHSSAMFNVRHLVGRFNLDPESGAQDARVMKSVVRLNGNNAGVYAAVVCNGTIRVGDRVSLL